MPVSMEELQNSSDGYSFFVVVSGMSGENDSGDDTEAKIDSVSRTESPRNEETQITGL